MSGISRWLEAAGLAVLCIAAVPASILYVFSMVVIGEHGTRAPAWVAWAMLIVPIFVGLTVGFALR